MTETRWVKVGTFTTQVEADEVLAVLVAAQIPYSQSGVLLAGRTGSIEFHVPNEFVEAAKAAFARALEEREQEIDFEALAAARTEAGAEIAEDDTPPDPEFVAQLERDRRRVRVVARAQVAMIAIVCAIGVVVFAKKDNTVLMTTALAFALVFVAVLVVSFRRGDPRSFEDTRKDFT